MTSLKEKVIREMYNPEIKASAQAKIFSRIFDIDMKSCQNYISVMKRGFSSSHEYSTEMARRKGFESMSDYVAFRKEQRGVVPNLFFENMEIPNNSYYLLRQQINFEEDIEEYALRKNRNVKKIYFEYNDNYYLALDALIDLLNSDLLNDKEMEIILDNYGIFGKNKKDMKDIQKGKNETLASLYFTRKTALKKLRRKLTWDYGIDGAPSKYNSNFLY
ncbi:hypothetical protein KY334_01335 [Candidatus Woesearchaeota archaeon]|nr:hypothetical protein [Candidatus Woesearchaeota archaeon]